MTTVKTAEDARDFWVLSLENWRQVRYNTMLSLNIQANASARKLASVLLILNLWLLAADMFHRLLVVLTHYTREVLIHGICCKAVGLDSSFDLLGHSLGTFIAASYAGQFPVRQSLIVFFTHILDCQILLKYWLKLKSQLTTATTTK